MSIAGLGDRRRHRCWCGFVADVIDLKPVVVVVLAGTNDIAGNTGEETLEQIEGGYATMAELARVHGIRMVFAFGDAHQ
jgi:hypothetical protein